MLSLQRIIARGRQLLIWAMCLFGMAAMVAMAGCEGAPAVDVSEVSPSASGVQGKPSDSSQRPNIIVIFTDDHGFADLGLQSADGLAQTPHTDQLALDGVRFGHGFVTAPQCSPSRAGLLTGIYQGRFGMETNRLGPLPASQITLADRLAAAGYATGMAGKWHLDVNHVNRHNLPPDVDETSYKADKRGFQEYFAGTRQRYRASHTASGQGLANAPQQHVDEQFRIDAATQWSLHFIQRHQDQPFFLYLPYFAPHVPLEAPPGDLAVFSEDIGPNRRQALAMIYAMDRGVGEIRERLQELGLTERTLIFYAGDNGAPTFPERDNGSSNMPLLGEKGMLTDGGVRVPFLMAWPGVVRPGVYPYLASTLDISATALAAAGVAKPVELEGYDLVAANNHVPQQPVREALFWRFRTQSAVRSMEWKAIALSDGTELLFDLRNGAEESRNVRDQFPQIYSRMQAQLQSWSQTLSPPGLARGDLHPGDQEFYAHHQLLQSAP